MLLQSKFYGCSFMVPTFSPVSFRSRGIRFHLKRAVFLGSQPFVFPTDLLLFQTLVHLSPQALFVSFVE